MQNDPDVILALRRLIAADLRAQAARDMGAAPVGPGKDRARD
ncbi:MAG: hypothetical protein ACK4KW_00320 [Gemmobacter sp.]